MALTTPNIVFGIANGKSLLSSERIPILYVWLHKWIRMIYEPAGGGHDTYPENNAQPF